MLVTLCGLTSCKKASVNIKTISAAVEAAPTKLSANKTNGGLIKLGNSDNEEPAVVEHTQYIVMYKSEKDIKFTIELDNPKGHAIDAVELRCDDVNATILVDGNWEKISSKDGYVVNWASENAYKKTYYLQTISQERLSTLTVSDIKINGKWQNAALDNNALKIYKMSDSDLKWEFVKNVPEYYEWRFVTSENVSNIQEMGAELTENGTYKAKKNGVVQYIWDYTFNGETVTWDGEKNIVLLEFKKNTYYEKDFLCYEDQFQINYGFPNFISATDFKVTYISIDIDGIIFTSGTEN